MKLKTNVMCGSCIAKITPVLNEMVGEGNWKVDTIDPKKILTVNSDSINEDQVINALGKVGYKAEVI